MKKRDAYDALRAAAKAALYYFAVVFVCGFALSAIRVLAVVPRIGELKAVLLELPFMLLASWLASAWLAGRFSLGRGLAPRAVMGGLAFALLQGAELAL